MRGLLLLALLALVLVVVFPVLRGWRLRLGAPPSPRGTELVKDPVCQTYVVRSRAVQRGDGERAVFFCSADCAERYAGGGRRA
jgi:hypothetical protein